MSDWISVKDRLPELYQAVALMSVDRYANNGELPVNNPHIIAAGYLSEWGNKYWSVRGEQSLMLDAFTHWMPLPEPPEASDE